MQQYQEKINLILEMISFSTIDGKLHDREFQFISIIASYLGFSKEEINDLFHKEAYPEVIKNKFERIQQFYRLALLMYSHGVLHEREQIRIHEIGISMGLNPHAMKRVLKAMSESPNKSVSAEFLLQVFQEQLN